MTETLYPTHPPYSALTRVIGQQARELYPKADWDDVASELETLWASYVTVGAGPKWPTRSGPPGRMRIRNCRRIRARHPDAST